jgi:hypothetical protein
MDEVIVLKSTVIDTSVGWLFILFHKGPSRFFLNNSSPHMVQCQKILKIQINVLSISL